MIFTVLVFRIAGVLCCLIKMELNRKERIFCMIAYMPKATVQAVEVLAILITAPLGTFWNERFYKRLLVAF